MFAGSCAATSGPGGGCQGVTAGGSGADRGAALNLKRIFNAQRRARDDRAGAMVKDCYVASGGDVTGVTSDVTWGRDGFRGRPDKASDG
ncbi:hypothetical protein F01_460474 [Burkholderia cenocepacia]|nr:hypothetical protein F01_460474 [Burkholderia cenocepacia]